MAQVAVPVARVRREDRPLELDAAAQGRLLAGLGARGLEDEEPLPEAPGGARVRHVRQPPERLGPEGTGGKGGDQLVEQRVRGRPVARGDEVVGGGEAAPGRPGAVAVRRQPAGLARQVGGHVGGASLRHLRGRPLEVGRQPLVGPLGSQREVQCALGRVSDPAGQVLVDRSPLDRARGGVDRRPVEGVGEAQRVAGALQEPGRDGALEQVRRRVNHLHRRPRERGDLKQQPPQSAIDAAHPVRHQLRERRRRLSGLARRQARARAEEAAELEGVERVPPRPLEHGPEPGSREGEPEALAEHQAERGEVHRPELDPVDEIRSERILEPGGGTPVAPARRDQPHRRLVESAEREAQRPGARLVEPLEVVNREDQGSRARGLLQGPEHGDGDQEVHGRRAIRLAAEEDRVERPRLGGGAPAAPRRRAPTGGR